MLRTRIISLSGLVTPTLGLQPVRGLQNTHYISHFYGFHWFKAGINEMGGDVRGVEVKRGGGGRGKRERRWWLWDLRHLLLYKGCKQKERDIMT